jgi:hypothetical protein
MLQMASFRNSVDTRGTFGGHEDEDGDADASDDDDDDDNAAAVADDDDLAARVDGGTGLEEDLEHHQQPGRPQVCTSIAASDACQVS